MADPVAQLLKLLFLLDAKVVQGVRKMFYPNHKYHNIYIQYKSSFKDPLLKSIKLFC